MNYHDCNDFNVQALPADPPTKNLTRPCTGASSQALLLAFYNVFTAKVVFAKVFLQRFVKVFVKVFVKMIANVMTVNW